MSTPEQQPERKEVIQLNGLTILTILVIFANFLVVGFIYRYHGHELYRENKAHDKEYTVLLRQQHELHDEIIKLEHVSLWDETQYVKAGGHSE